MGRPPRLTPEQPSTAIGMLHGGMPSKAVAEHFGVAASTISRLKGIFYEIWRVQDRPRSWGHKKTSAADDRYMTLIVVTSLRNRLMSAPKLTKQFHATSGIRVSTQTIWNRLQKRDLCGRRPYNYSYGQPRSCAFELGTAHHR